MSAPGAGDPGAPADLRALALRARETGDLAALLEALPYARFLGMSLTLPASGTADEGSASPPADPRLVVRLAFAPHIVGNSLIPALHGGAVASLLEAAAYFQLLWEGASASPPRIIGVTVDYVRTARTVDTFARADITRQGRRIATVHAQAWQADPQRPVATANVHFLLGPR